MRLTRTHTLILITLVLLSIRLLSLDWSADDFQTPVLTWDALGYYIYLPGFFIYGDIDKMAWLPEIVELYQSTPHIYQIFPIENGNNATKYLMGLSILYAPFFGLGHLAAGVFDYPQDGFSAPYQLAICLGALVYAVLGLWILAKVLGRFFSEKIVLSTLLLTALATNFPEYTAIESGMTHGYLFAVYACCLWLTIRWHDQPSLGLTFALGLLIGIATITRPTEGIMLFIPLLWQWEGFEKWAFIKKNPRYIATAIAGGFLGILPQLLYWKHVTGSWIFDVGSKWYFLNPWWRVLFGAEKGWFLYTPITICMIAGLFFLKNRPFRKAVLTFSLLNIWIIIAWSDWRYGASYSCRALLQGTAVLALPLAVFLEKIKASWVRPVFVLGSFLVVLNLFQIYQYKKTILHYDDMNFKYYRAIFMNPSPSPLDMSLLDTDEYLRDDSDYVSEEVFLQKDSTVFLAQQAQVPLTFYRKEVAIDDEHWYKISAKIRAEVGAFGASLSTTLEYPNGARKETHCRLQNGITTIGAWNDIVYFFKVPSGAHTSQLTVFAQGGSNPLIEFKEVQVERLRK